MKRWSYLCVSVSLLAAAAPASPPAAARTAVLLELFTSEGCSSCPPADRLLETLDQTQPVDGAEIIVLSEHVDYWNRLGWADPYSSPAFSERQQAYATKFGIDSVYTPQLVVDGRAQLVGSDAGQAKSAIAKAVQSPKTAVTLSPAVRLGGQIKVTVTVAMLRPGDQVYVAVADNQARSQVTRGENAGRLLPHVAVVRTLTPVAGGKSAGPFSQEVTIPSTGGGSGGVRVVAFVQNRATRHIQGAAQQRL